MWDRGWACLLYWRNTLSGGREFWRFHCCTSTALNCRRRAWKEHGASLEGERGGTHLQPRAVCNPELFATQSCLQLVKCIVYARMLERDNHVWICVTCKWLYMLHPSLCVCTGRESLRIRDTWLTFHLWFGLTGEAILCFTIEHYIESQCCPASCTASQHYNNASRQIIAIMTCMQSQTGFKS